MSALGRLVVCSSFNNGAWEEPLPLSDPGVFSTATSMVTSPRFGAGDEKDVFIFDQNGALNIYTSALPGSSWTQSVVTNDGVGSPGSPLAVAPQFSQAGKPTQTDVFFVDSNGALFVAYSVGLGPWSLLRLSADGLNSAGGPLAAAPHGPSTMQTDVFLVDVTGTLQQYYVGPDGLWHNQAMFLAGKFTTYNPIATSPSLGNTLGTQFDGINVYIVDPTGALVVYSAVGSNGWSNQQVTSAGFTFPGTPLAALPDFNSDLSIGEIDVFIFDRTSTLNSVNATKNGSWNNIRISGSGITPQGGADLAASPLFSAASGQRGVFFIDSDGELTMYTKSPAIGAFWYGGRILPEQCGEPPFGFGSNSNLILSNYPLPLPDLTVTVTITEDIEFDANGPREFAIQLNCFTYPEGYYGWQQYVLGGYVDSSNKLDIYAFINDWDASVSNVLLDSDPSATVLLTQLPNARIPAGYKFELILRGDINNLYGVRFWLSTVYDETGKQIGFADYDLLALTATDGKKVAPNQLTPIVAFEVDLVGFVNFARANLISGAGIINYISSSALVASQPVAPGIQFTDTGETSNIQYQYLPSTQGSSSCPIPQRFVSVVKNGPFANGKKALAPLPVPGRC